MVSMPSNLDFIPGPPATAVDAGLVHGIFLGSNGMPPPADQPARDGDRDGPAIGNFMALCEGSDPHPQNRGVKFPLN